MQLRINYENNFFNFHKNEKNIIFKNTFKIIFQQFFLLATFTVFVVLTILGFNNAPNVSFDLMSTELHLYRSLFIVFLPWYIFFSIWSIKTGIDFILNKKLLLGIFSILSFIPIFSFYLIYYFISKITKDNVDYYKKLLFEQDDWIKERYTWNSWRRILILVLFIILLPVCGFVFVREAEGILAYKNNIWFYSFHYFTIQGNIMALIFTFVLLFFPGLRIFKTNCLQSVVTVYIFVVGLVWNALLLPGDIKSGAILNWTQYQWASTVFYHIINPLVFTIISLVLFFKSPFKNTYLFSSIFKLGLPYILIYYLYIVVTPFTAGFAVYGIANTNPELIINGNQGGGIAWVYIFAVLAIFVFLFWLLYFLEKKINSKKIIMSKN